MDTGANPRRARSGEEGQTVALVLMALGLFLVGTIALAVDFTYLWFRQQAAQNAADAACGSGAMDMLLLATGGTVTPTHLEPPNSFTCSNTDISMPANYKVPCWYAAVNGYTSPGLSANAASNLVSGSFPDISACPGSGCPAPGAAPPGGASLPTAWNGKAFLQIDVVERARVYFLGMFTGSRTQDVKARSVCGIVAGSQPSPITVLAPTGSGALKLNGSGTVTIYGGPQRSIEVNSSNSTAITSSAACNIDLSHGGPGSNGSNVAVYGGPSTGVCNFSTNCPSCSWVAGAIPGTDPFQTLAAPSQPADPLTPNPIVDDLNFGCPDSTGCVHYQPGHYSSDIQVKGMGTRTQTAIFDPGIYYLGDATHNVKLDIGSNSCVRPSTATGDGSNGVIFYFYGTKSLSVTGGDCSPATGQTISAYTTANSKCTGASVLPPSLPSTVSGSVLLAPCQLPTQTTVCTPNCSINYGDPLGMSNPVGEQRGILFYQNRSQSLTGGNQPSWAGGGNFFVAGNIYFHNCTANPCNVSDYTDVFSFGQTGVVIGYFSGSIVADQFTLQGNSPLTMYLNPNSGYIALKVSLIR